MDITINIRQDNYDAILRLLTGISAAARNAAEALVVASDARAQASAPHVLTAATDATGNIRAHDPRKQAAQAAEQLTHQAINGIAACIMKSSDLQNAVAPPASKKEPELKIATG